MVLQVLPVGFVYLYSLRLQQHEGEDAREMIYLSEDLRMQCVEMSRKNKVALWYLLGSVLFRFCHFNLQAFQGCHSK